MKHGCDYPESSKGGRPFCAFHNVHSHNTNDCQELRALRDGRLGHRLSVATEATAAEVVEVEDAGRIVTLARAGAISLVRAHGETSLVRVPGGISLTRTVRKATLAFLRCHRRQEGTTTVTKMMGLGASKNLEPSPASWAALRPQHLIASSSSLLVR
jgi:hypothetical protein